MSRTDDPGRDGDVQQVLADSALYFRDQLQRTDARAARQLLEDRGLPAAAAQAYELGYAQPSWNALTRRLLLAGHPEPALVAAGLCVRTRGGRLADRFRDRLMFPVHDRHGAVVAFLGRTAPAVAARDPDAATALALPSFGPDRASPTCPVEPPKYLGSPCTNAYAKRESLYGLGATPAQAALAAGATPVLVEGPLDAIAVTWASGCEGADSGQRVRFVGVATCGTALTPEQVQLLLPLLGPALDRILVAYDSDTAGMAGAVRAFDLLRQAGAWPGACRLPQGHDPASLLGAAGPEALLDALRGSVPLADLAVEARLNRWATTRQWAEGQVHAARDAAALIAQLPAQHIARQVQRVQAHLELPGEEITRAVIDALPHVVAIGQQSAARSNASAYSTQTSAVTSTPPSPARRPQPGAGGAAATGSTAPAAARRAAGAAGKAARAASHRRSR